ncbi:MAG: hypothetical protein ACR2FN_08570 [Chitinophagaceae bacterium]
MKQNYFILICLLIFNTAYSQDTLTANSTKALNGTDTSFHKMSSVFHARIINTNNKLVKGYIIGFNDSTLAIYPVNSNAIKQEFNYKNLSKISIRRKGNAWRGALWGGVIGVISGAIIGASSKDDPNSFIVFNSGEKALLGGISLGIDGAIIGAIVGAIVRTTFTIHGKKENYNKLQSRLRKYAY